jgi:hypothetical protein
MCLTDLLQWGELYRKTGAITVKKRYREKNIFPFTQRLLKMNYFNPGELRKNISYFIYNKKTFFNRENIFEPRKGCVPEAP